MANGLESRKEFIQHFIKEHPTCEAGELYDALQKEWPDISRSGHRSLVYRELSEEARPWEKEHECPKCGVKAAGLEALEGTFGFRRMGDGKRRVQSWCRGCRLEDARKRREAKKKAEAARIRAAQKAAKSRASKAAKAMGTDLPLFGMSPETLAAEFTNANLKEGLRALDLKVSGTKDALVARLHGELVARPQEEVAA